jgi:DNA-binding LytR/AlgR family response regulator
VMSARPTAIIAEDEAPQRRELRASLETLWPELEILAECADGDEARAAVQHYRPQIAFLDIRMPGASGLEVAKIASATSHVVLVTAYDQYAVDAFETGAIDYLLKPVKQDRLSAAVERLKAKLSTGAQQQDLTRLIDSLQSRINAERSPYLRWITATTTGGVKMVAIDDIRFFQAEDKYVRVGSAAGDVHIRTPLKVLLAKLDPDVFWQIHRGTVVRVSAIKRIVRGDDHRLKVILADSADALSVSAAFEHRFRGM